jgi:hypothetical protein
MHACLDGVLLSLDGSIDIGLFLCMANDYQRIGIGQRLCRLEAQRSKGEAERTEHFIVVCFAVQDPHQQKPAGPVSGISTASASASASLPKARACSHSPLEFEDCPSQVARYITALLPPPTTPLDHHAHRRVTIDLLRIVPANNIIQYNYQACNTDSSALLCCRYPRLPLHRTFLLSTLPRAFRSIAQQCTRTPRTATASCRQ